MLDPLLNFWSNHAEKIIDISYKALLALALLFTSYLVAKAIRRSIINANHRFAQFDETLIPVFCTTATYSVYAVGIIIILDVFGVNTASIITLLGAAGLAIGLAIKDTLSNIAAGIMLLVLRPFRVEHFIESGDMMGTVKEIGLFTTILETLDGLYISAPNSSLWGAPIKNYTRNGKRRMDLIVGISYTDSIDTGYEALQKVIAAEARFLPEPAPQVMVQAMADSSVNLQLRAWTSVDDYWEVYWHSNKQIKEAIEAAGLTIPFPQRDLHLISGKF